MGGPFFRTHKEKPAVVAGARKGMEPTPVRHIRHCFIGLLTSKVTPVTIPQSVRPGFFLKDILHLDVNGHTMVSQTRFLKKIFSITFST